MARSRQIAMNCSAIAIIFAIISFAQAELETPLLNVADCEYIMQPVSRGSNNIRHLTPSYTTKDSKSKELSDDIKEIIQHVHNECVSKTGVAEEDIKNCENGIFKEDEKLKCYMFCLMEEANLADDDGTVDYDMMVSIIPEQYADRVTKMIFACRHLDTPDKSKCQRAFDVHKCSYSKDPDIYFLF